MVSIFSYRTLDNSVLRKETGQFFLQNQTKRLMQTESLGKALGFHTISVRFVLSTVTRSHLYQFGEVNNAQPAHSMKRNGDLN